MLQLPEFWWAETISFWLNCGSRAVARERKYLNANENVSAFK
jgi:hypothetical protein